MKLRALGTVTIHRRKSFRKLKVMQIVFQVYRDLAGGGAAASFQTLS
jgi:hypothetical protein